MKFVNNWQRPITLAAGAATAALDLPDGTARRAFEAKDSSVPMPPSMSIQPSCRVAPVRRLSAWNSSFIAISAVPSAFSMPARSWKDRARRAGPPTRRP